MRYASLYLDVKFNKYRPFCFKDICMYMELIKIRFKTKHFHEIKNVENFNVVSQFL